VERKTEITACQEKSLQKITGYKDALSENYSAVKQFR